MEIFQAIVLAVVQGITEFLPVSSSAHLVLTPIVFGWQDQGLVFDVAVHVGTLIAVIFYLRDELNRMVPAWFAGWAKLSWDQEGRLAWSLAIATIPVGLVGLLANDWIEANLRSASVIAATMLVFGVLLGVSDRGAQNNKKELAAINFKYALFAGLAQAFALIPGTSRSGITMTALLFAGFTRQVAAKYSFMLAIPVIGLSGVLKLLELVQAELVIEWTPILIAVAVSALIAFFSMKWFMAIVQHLGMMPFVIYRILLAIVIMLVVY